MLSKVDVVIVVDCVVCFEVTVVVLELDVVGAVVVVVLELGLQVLSSQRYSGKQSSSALHPQVWDTRSHVGFGC